MTMMSRKLSQCWGDGDVLFGCTCARVMLRLPGLFGKMCPTMGAKLSQFWGLITMCFATVGLFLHDIAVSRPCRQDALSDEREAQSVWGLMTICFVTACLHARRCSFQAPSTE